MARNVMILLVGKRKEAAVRVQELLTEYGCEIKTRLGLHEAGNVCSDEGLILLELTGSEDRQNELYKKLDKIECVTVKKEHLCSPSC